MIRSRFKNGLLLNADYKTLEVYVAALISHDTGVIQTLLEGGDIHSRNASVAFGIPIESVTPEQRQSSKSVTFGVMYGEGASGMASKKGITIQEAQDIIDKILSAMPILKQNMEAILAFAERYGYVSTLQGNYRRLPDAKRSNRALKARALRQAYNAVVQGSGAYFTNSSLIIIRSQIKKLGLKSRIIATVHDSILIDVHPDEVMKVVPMVKYIMENLPIKELIENPIGDLNVPDKYNLGNGNYRFPLKAEANIGLAYSDESEWDIDKIREFKSFNDYIMYNRKISFIEDKYNTLLGKLPKDAEEQRNSLIEKRDTEISNIEK